VPGVRRFEPIADDLSASLQDIFSVEQWAGDAPAIRPTGSSHQPTLLAVVACRRAAFSATATCWRT